MKRLTGQQIGRIAKYVERAIQDNPSPGRKTGTGPNYESWEKQLAKAVMDDPLLPTYKELNKDYFIADFIDQLVSYFD